MLYMLLVLCPLPLVFFPFLMLLYVDCVLAQRVENWFQVACCVLFCLLADPSVYSFHSFPV